MPIFDRKTRTRPKAGEPVADMRFEARCPAGHELSGQRTESFQAVRCRQCGDGVFVGPTSWLPVPPAAVVYDLIPLGSIRDVAPSGKTAKQVAEEADDEARESFAAIPLKDSEAVAGSAKTSLPVEDPAAKFEVAPTREIADGEFQKLVDRDAQRRSDEEQRRAKPAASRKPAREEPREDRRDEAPEDESDQEPVETGPRVPLYKRVSPKVWVGLGVLLVIGLTVRSQIRQNYRDRIPEIVKKARTEGLESLDAGRFDEAKQILSDAANAFDYLREDSDDAKQIRQAAREAAILADLVGRPLDEIIDRFAAGEAGKADFKTLDAGRSLVVEARVTATPDEGGGYELDFRVPVGPGPTPARTLGKLDVRNLELMANLKPKKGDNVLIGVRLKDLALGDGFWSVQVDPKSGVLMTRWKALEAIGWPVTDRPGDAPEGEKP